MNNQKGGKQLLKNTKEKSNRFINSSSKDNQTEQKISIKKL